MLRIRSYISRRVYYFPASSTAHSQQKIVVDQVGTYREFVFFDERQVFWSQKIPREGQGTTVYPPEP